MITKIPVVRTSFPSVFVYWKCEVLKKETICSNAIAKMEKEKKISAISLL